MANKKFHKIFGLSLILFLSAFSYDAFGYFRGNYESKISKIENDFAINVSNLVGVATSRTYGALSEAANYLEKDVSPRFDLNNFNDLKSNRKNNVVQTAAISDAFNIARDYLGGKINNFIESITTNAPIVFDGVSQEVVVDPAEEALQMEKEKFDFIRKETSGTIESGYVKTTSQVPATQVIEIRLPVERVVERTISPVSQVASPIISSLNVYTKSEIDNLLKNYNQTLKSELINQINNVSVTNNRQYAANTVALGLTSKIDNLSGTSLTNVTVNGVSGLTDSDIPDGIPLLII